MKIAYALPEKVLTNAELAALYPGWTDEKILQKTGIASRHVTAEGETAVDLAERAARRLFDDFASLCDKVGCGSFFNAVTAASYLLRSASR